MSAFHRTRAFIGLAILATSSVSLAQEAKAVKVINPHSGRTTVVLMKLEGSRVKAGDMVCELDSSVHVDLIEKQRVTIKSAEAAYANAQLTREVSEIAVARFQEEQAKTNKEVLEKDTKAKSIKELKTQAEKARADELTKKAALELEMTISTQIKDCRVVAPIAGRVVYPRAIAADTVFGKDDVLFEVVPDRPTK
jgi:multidrug efflux pump subunit AcrA (membrane-fusion protein)